MVVEEPHQVVIEVVAVEVPVDGVPLQEQHQVVTLQDQDL